MREHVEWIILAVLIALAVINNSVMGEDRERAELSRIRDSSGYLIKYYGQAN
jgi:hypothetical protein